MQDQSYLPPRFLQIVGVLLLLLFAGFWMATGRQSTLLVGAAGSLILLGGAYDKARQALDVLKTPLAPPPPLDPPGGSAGSAPPLEGK